LRSIVRHMFKPFAVGPRSDIAREQERLRHARVGNPPSGAFEMLRRERPKNHA
jgi:hypothetical protein